MFLKPNESIFWMTPSSIHVCFQLSEALAQIKSQTPRSLFKSIRFNWRWRKWAICNIHELGTSQVWPLSEWLYNCLGCALHNRYSQAPRAPIKPNLVSESRPLLCPAPPQPHYVLIQVPRKTLPSLWSVLSYSLVYKTELKALITLLQVPICFHSMWVVFL